MLTSVYASAGAKLIAPSLSDDGMNVSSQESLYCSPYNETAIRSIYATLSELEPKVFDVFLLNHIAASVKCRESNSEIILSTTESNGERTACSNPDILDEKTLQNYSILRLEAAHASKFKTVEGYVRFFTHKNSEITCDVAFARIQKLKEILRK